MFRLSAIHGHGLRFEGFMLVIYIRISQPAYELVGALSRQGIIDEGHTVFGSYSEPSYFACISAFMSSRYI